MNTIEISSVSKEYRNHVCALKNISLNIGSGVFGLLGHNGAGKTTLMKLITTILRPTAGQILVMGYDSKKQGDEVRRCIGYLPQELDMYQNLSVYDFVEYMARLKGISEKKPVIYALEQVGMEELKKRKIGQLSGGMKRRVGIAQALVCNPQILVVDEPTAGLDPEERVRFRGILSGFAKDDKTVLMSTHIVEDVYQLCERIAVLKNGDLFFAGFAQELLNQVHGKIKIIRLTGDKELLQLRQKVTVISTIYGEAGIKARIADDHSIYSAPAVQETLEDAYVYCMEGKNHG